MQDSRPNAQQSEYWNEQAGPKWAEESQALDAMLEPIGLVGIERAEVRPGARVLDVGCGTGQTTLQLAERAGPGGEVLGLDLSLPMLAVARSRAERAGLTQVRFEQGDAQIYPLRGNLDRIFSRLGVMFFADPVAAFGNLRSGLAPGGKLTFVSWQPLDRNPWLGIPLQALAKHVELPEPEPGAPGPFTLADPDRVRAVLEGAGFSRVELESLEIPLTLGGRGGVEGALRFIRKIGPGAVVLRDHPEVREAALDSIGRALGPHVTDSAVTLDSASWIVTARP